MKKSVSDDNSQYVYQEEKFKGKLLIKDKFKWTEKQKKFIEIASSKDTKIIICKGVPGSGKTLLSTYCSLQMLLSKKISKIIFYRNPIESCSKSLGFLKGEYEEKIAPYGAPLFDHLYELLSGPEVEKLIKEKFLSIDSIGFAKGRTHNVVSMICDESEDLTVQELELIMGRMGKFSKLFLIGDERQANIRNSGFADVYDLFNNEESRQNGIHTFEFDANDCMRNEILKFIIEKFDKLHKR